MKYAVKKSDGSYSTVLYNESNQHIISHHAERGEELVPVQGLDIEWGEDGEPISVTPVEISIEQWRKSASLSRRRFKIGEALYQVNGTPLVELIEALLAGLPEPTKTVATIAYNESGSFDRLDPFILQFSQALGMSEEETDDFFKFCMNEEWNQ